MSKTAARDKKHYKLKTAMDVAKLFAVLDPEGRAILAKDLVLAGQGYDKIQNIPLIKSFTRLNSLTWIDDDKGRGEFVLSAGADGPELARWDVFGGAEQASGKE